MSGESAEENQTFCRKKLGASLKGKKGDKTCTNIIDEANLLNSQFQSVFSIRAPLDLMKLCRSTMLNGAISLVNLYLSSDTESINF